METRARSGGLRRRPGNARTRRGAAGWRVAGPRAADQSGHTGWGTWGCWGGIPGVQGFMAESRCLGYVYVPDPTYLVEGLERTGEWPRYAPREP